MGRNPYLDARREWNERYGEFVAQAKQWRVIAALCCATAFAAVVGVVWIGSQSKLVPYLVEVTRKGEVVSGHLASPTSAMNDDLVRSIVAGFVEDWRSVSVDAGVQQKVIARTYAHLSSGDPAYNAVNGFFQTNNPFERAAKETVTIEIRSVLKTSASSFQIEWQEETRDRRGGAVIAVAHFKAAAIVALVPPAKEEEIMQNPIGLYVRELTWSRELTNT